MNTPELTAINFDRYHQLIRAQIPQLLSWLVMDADGAVIFSTADTDTDPLSDFISEPPCHTEKSEWIRHYNEKILIGHSIITANDTYWGEIHLMLEGDADHALAVSRFIADNLSIEIALQDELNSMARELTERYEELNLVYEAEEQSTAFDTNQQAIIDMVSNCIDYLDVEFAFLWLPQQKIEVSQLIDEKLTISICLTEQNNKQSILNHIRLIDKSIVINKTSELLDHSLQQLPPYKLIATPIRGIDNNCIGLFLLANSLHKTDFSNSDRNLLEVMGRKVTKLVLSIYDEQTGLLKREGFEFHLQQALNSCHFKGNQHALITLNIDNFSIVNDTIGYASGNQLLLTITDILHEEIRDSDTLARLGGDTFALLLKNCPLSDANNISERLLSRIKKIAIGENRKCHNISASIALSEVDNKTKSIDSLLAGLDITMMLAKDKGGDRVQLYASNDQDLTSRTKAMHWVSHIQSALRDNQFVLYYQTITPLINTESDEPHGEVLIRYMDDSGNIIPPGEFLPAAEQYHMMPAIDLWVIENTLSHIKLAQTGTWSINLSGQSLSESTLIMKIINLIKQSGIDPRRLCFEITETAAISNLREAKIFIDHLRKLGCRTSLDDFGTGLSSFSYLRELNVDYLKIDGSFVSEIANDPIAFTMVKAIHEVGSAMGLKTIAEFVEDQTIRDYLINLGVDYAQGYYYGKPQPLELVNS